MMVRGAKTMFALVVKIQTVLAHNLALMVIAKSSHATTFLVVPVPIVLLLTMQLHAHAILDIMQLLPPLMGVVSQV